MKALQEYIIKHADRGECNCGQCFDRGVNRDAPAHSVDVHFFWVSARNNPTKEELRQLLVANYPDLDRLAAGPSYIELGGVLGDQGLALMLLGLGEIVKLWRVVTPKTLGATGEQANQLAGAGYVMCTGMRATVAA